MCTGECAHKLVPQCWYFLSLGDGHMCVLYTILPLCLCGMLHDKKKIVIKQNEKERIL